MCLENAYCQAHLKMPVQTTSLRDCAQLCKHFGRCQHHTMEAVHPLGLPLSTPARLFLSVVMGTVLLCKGRMTGHSRSSRGGPRLFFWTWALGAIM